VPPSRKGSSFLPQQFFSKLSKDTFIYGFGNIFSKGASLILLPIYTRLFTPAEYGIIEMLTIVTSFLSIILMFGMTGAQNFFFFEQKQNGKQHQARLVTGILQFRLIWGVLILAIAMIFSPFLNSWLFDEELTWVVFAAAFSGAWFYQIMSQGADIYRLLFRPWPYLIITTIHSLISAAIAIGLVIWLNGGLTGYFVGLSIGALASSIGSWWFVRDYINWSNMHKDWWQALLKFGWPLIFGGLAMTIRNSSDRIFIKYFLSFNHMGIYASSIKVAAIASAISGIFILAFTPYSQELLHNNDKAKANKIFELSLRYYGFIFLSLVIIIATFAPYIVKLILPRNYFSSHYMVGILSLSSVFLGLTSFSSLGSWKTKKTSLYSISVVIATCITIIMNYFLIPLHGLYGAAVSSAAGMLSLVFFSFYFSHICWPISFNYATLVIQIFICLLGLLSIHISSLLEEGFQGRFLIMAGFLVILMGISVRKSEIRQLNVMWKQLKS